MFQSVQKIKFKGFPMLETILRNTCIMIGKTQIVRNHIKFAVVFEEFNNS